MTARERILRLLEPEGGGPRKLTVIAGLLGEGRAKRALASLRRERLVRVTRYGNRGGAHFELVPQRRVA